MRLKKIFVASFNRASDGAISKLRRGLRRNGIVITTLMNDVEYILACGDRKETFEFCLEWYGKIPIIHLWAGEVSQGTHDEIYRWAITQMSIMQLCTNVEAADRVRRYFIAVGMSAHSNAKVVGNVMLDNMPSTEYDVVLYNPPTVVGGQVFSDENNNLLTHKQLLEHECNLICEMLGETYFWIEPNGDEGSGVVAGYVNTPNLARPQFLSLVSNCRTFISNSSCIDYEIKHMLKPEQIVRIGERNKKRESMTSDMTIPDATENIIRILKEL